MSSFCLSALSSLDDSLARLGESLEKLKAARSVDFAEVIAQLKLSAEHARTVRELIWSELPDASWQTRKELDALIDKIQKILTARTIKQQRSRLLALANQLERGTIVHRRAHRLTELNQLRDQAVSELRSQANSDEAPQTLPGPQADQWIAWACALQEPQDTESLQTLRNGFVHLDDFVANLEPTMWVAGPSAPEPAPETETVVSPGPTAAARAAMENPPRRQPQPASAAPKDAPALVHALASLDAALALFADSVDKLKAARGVDLAEGAEQLKVAAESGHSVRGLVRSELPDASWQNRKELDALVDQIEKILAARALEQARSRLLALAAELESGTIVHRRAHRADELKHLRDQAVSELRSQAALDEPPQTLPGPEAGLWVEWACSLQEPQDAESLQALRNGFSHLDDFVANLEPSMWVPVGKPAREVPPEPPPPPAAKPPAEPPRPETTRMAEPVAPAAPAPAKTEATRPAKERGELRFPRHLDDLSPGVLQSNTLTPHDATPPHTAEEIEQMHAQERALLASMMGLASDPVAHFQAPAEPRPPSGPSRETSAASATLISEPAAHFNPPIEAQPAAAPARKTMAAAATLVSDPVEHFSRTAEPAFATEAVRETSGAAVGVVSEEVEESAAPAERPFEAAVFRETIIAPPGLVSDEAGHFDVPVEPALTTRIFAETSAAASSLAFKIKTGAEELWGGQRSRMLVIAAGSLALVVLAALLWRSGAVLWKPDKAGTAAAPAVAANVPDQSRSSNPQDKGSVQPVTATTTAPQPSSTKPPAKEQPKAPEQNAAAKTQPKEPPKPQEQSAAAKTPAKTPPATQASNSPAEVLRPAAETPAPAVTSRKEDVAPPNVTLAAPGSVPGAANAMPSSVASVLKDVPAAVPKIANQRVGISSGVAQGLLVRQVTPQYPPQARQAHIQGTVVLQAVIGKDGSVQGLNVVSGHPMLTQAAMDAVRRWRYKPYRLNGEPVEATTQINVNFTLSGQ